MSVKSGKIILPCAAEDLIPHRDAMLFIDTLLERDRAEGSGIADALIPPEGIFCNRETGFFQEYLVELMAQTTAAMNGYDAREDGISMSRGFLVGVDAFLWQIPVTPGDRVIIRMVKTFEFGAATILEGNIMAAGTAVATGKIKVWEEDKA